MILLLSYYKCKKDVEAVQCLDIPCHTMQCPNIPDGICVTSCCIIKLVLIYS